MTHAFITLILGALILVAGYAVGSLQAGRIAFLWLRGLPDPRSIGSGSFGATNMLRTGRKAVALATLLGDLGKGLIAVLLAHALASMAGSTPIQIQALTCLAGIMVVIGHCWPFYDLNGGGKGVATGLGVWLALHPLVGVIMLITWIVVALMSRFSSLSALVAFVTPLATLILLAQYTPSNLVSVGLLLGTALVILTVISWRHRGNIRRLLSGTEPRIRF